MGFRAEALNTLNHHPQCSGPNVTVGSSASVRSFAGKLTTTNANDIEDLLLMAFGKRPASWLFAETFASALCHSDSKGTELR